MIRLTHEPIDNARCLPDRADPRSGATILFLGTAREFTEGRVTRELEYDAYAEMATQVLAEIEQEARNRWPILECDIVHRLGRVAIGETCVVIRVVTPHRGDAFAAAAWIMDCIKERVPIWKCEHWQDGPPQWIHPEGDQAPIPPTRSVP